MLMPRRFFLSSRRLIGQTFYENPLNLSLVGCSSLSCTGGGSEVKLIFEKIVFVVWCVEQTGSCLLLLKKIFNDFRGEGSRPQNPSL